jgi:very-short-patch-repair endonuclease
MRHYKLIRANPTFQENLSKRWKRYSYQGKAASYRIAALETNNPLENRMKVILDDLRINYCYQSIIGNYRVDFLIQPQRLIVETDGKYHDLQKDKDALRDEWLKSQGYHVFHVPADAVFNSPESVKRQITSLLAGKHIVS